MPLAQNYKDDVALLESEAALTKTTVNSVNAALPTRQEPHVSEDLLSMIEYHPGISEETKSCFYFIRLHFIELRALVSFSSVILGDMKMSVYLSSDGSTKGNETI